MLVINSCYVIFEPLSYNHIELDFQNRNTSAELLNSIARTTTVEPSNSIARTTTMEPSNDRGIIAGAVVGSTLGVTLLVVLTAVIIGVVYYKVQQRRKMYVNELLHELNGLQQDMQSVCYDKEYCLLYFDIGMHYTCRTLLHLSEDRHQNNYFLKTESLQLNSTYSEYQMVSHAHSLHFTLSPTFTSQVSPTVLYFFLTLSHVLYTIPQTHTHTHTHFCMDFFAGIAN